jgi:hypothetical protein
MFPSQAALDEARRLMGSYWDDEEVYALVGDLDTLLRASGFQAVQWSQTAPCYWVVIARKS